VTSLASRQWSAYLSQLAKCKGSAPHCKAPLACLQGAACSPTGQRWERLVAACADSRQQHLYKLYVHALPNFTGKQTRGCWPG
jgi:hypothetical protein